VRAVVVLASVVLFLLLDAFASAAFSSTTNRRLTKKQLQKTRRRFRPRRLWMSQRIWCRPSLRSTRRAPKRRLTIAGAVREAQ
jgi:hypothetical protein